MDLYVPSSPRASRKLVPVAFLTFRHHIPFLILLLLSKRPSALLKLSKGVIFTPIASTDARGVHRHQAIGILSLYHSKRIHCLLPKAALNDAILFTSHAFARTRSSRYARTVWEIQCSDQTETVMCLLSYLGTMNSH